MPSRATQLRRLARSVPLMLLFAISAACTAEQDLADYFGRSTAGSTTGPSLPASALPSPTPTAPALPSPTAAPSTASPSPSPSASPSTSPGPTVAASATRPPNLPEFPVLRARARVVEYARLLANPGNFSGQLLFFDGRVNRVEDDGQGNLRARIRLAGGVFIHLVYEADTYWGQPLVQGDRVRIVGYLLGLSSQDEHGERVPEIEIYDLHLKFT